jgi:hypothetical protein
MHAWVSALGKPLLCLIEADGIVQAFCYDDDASTAVRLTACERFPRGIVVIFESKIGGQCDDA